MSQLKKMIYSPVGTLELLFDEENLISLSIIKDPYAGPFDQLSEFRAYFEGQATSIDLPVKLKGTAFQLKVWAAIARIPYGQTWSYTELAEAVGSGPRAVANACGQNPIPLVIPCHRVLRRDGTLGGYSAGQGLITKKQLLALEGVL